MSDSLQGLLATAQQHYRSGDFAAAESLYLQVLRQQPEQLEALSWLAIISDRLGKTDDSLRYYEQVLALKPDAAEMHSNLGSLLCRLGRMEEAIAHQQRVVELCPARADAYYNLGVVLAEAGQIDAAIDQYRQALAIDPNHTNAHNNLGTLFGNRGEVEAAIDHYQQVLAIDPDHANAHNNLAAALSTQGKSEEAIGHYERAIALQPDYASAHSNLGLLLQQQNRLGEAAEHLEKVIALQPESASAHNSLGIIFQKQGKLEQALASYRRAAELRPDYAGFQDNIGTVLHEQKKLDEAIAHYQRAIDLDPTCANAYSNMGTALIDQGKYEAAIAACQKALAIQPNHSDAHNNYASALLELNQFDQAIAEYEAAIRARPENSSAHLNLGITLLLLGNFERGWQEYHWRWETRQCPPLRYKKALWDGSPLDGKTILLTAEQGYGDTIQFVRYAPLVAARGGKVVIACQRPLLRLMSSLPGIERCIDRDRVNVDTHVHAPVLDLPLILGTRLENIPASVPYLAPLVTDIPPLPAPPDTRLKVGIAWAANPTSSTANRRSCGLERFLALLEIPGVTLYSLQKDVPEADVALLKSHDRLIDLRDRLHDFADTAAVMAHLDLILSVDTSVIHLAGALGRPTWTLLAELADWRWMRDRTDTPWYPTMRLFRQPTAGDWDTVFAQVAAALRAELDQPEPLSAVRNHAALVPPPNLAQTHLRLGYSYYHLGQIEDAIAHYQTALEHNPDLAEAHNNLGVALCQQGKIAEALACYSRALQLQPAYADAHLNRAIAWLLSGDLARGFAEYTWRWQTGKVSLPYPTALWDGSDLAGRSILLTAEQGFGDTIQFVRYASLVRQRGGQVVIACQKPLVRLFSTIPGIDRCIDRDAESVEVNVHAPLMELPRILGTTLETIPNQVPYLSAAASNFALPPHPRTAKNLLRVGIVWATRSPNQTGDYAKVGTALQRSCALTDLLPLLQREDVAFYSLQKAATPAEQQQLAELEVCDISDSLTDFADTAAAIAQLDLMISIDSAVVHLAGALGKPTWLLLSAAPDWRWLLERQDNPWYPTMRLFRQESLGDWSSAIASMAEALEIQAAEAAKTAEARSSALSLPGFNQLVQGRHGAFVYNRHDVYIGRSLELYGEWSEGEVTIFQLLLRPGDTVVEVGANIGTHTVFFAKAIGSEGKVYAFEPQRVVFQTLCANLALNSLTNVYAYPIALGDAPGMTKIPALDYTRPSNFGGVSLNPQFTGESVQVALLDNFVLPQCRLLKIDAEGMELPVLKGAIDTIQRCQPLLYVENDRQEHAAELIRFLTSLGYELYWHRPPIYNPDNYFRNAQNAFQNIVSVNMIGILPGHGIKITGLPAVV